MDYFKEAFEGFAPHKDQDAALKFSLNVIAMDERFEELSKLMAPSDLGGMEGEPGWGIERRENGETLGYEDWPTTANYRAYVDPEFYCLEHPLFFSDEATFNGYVAALVKAYASRHPNGLSKIKPIQTLLNK